MYVSYSQFARGQALTTVSGFNASIVGIRNDITKHFNLERTNRKLQWENKWLRMRLKNSNYQIDKGSIEIDDTTYKQQYEYIPASVIQGTYDKRNNYLTLDIGSIHGVKKEDGVFSSKGVVGTVLLVGKRFCLVKTILSQNINIDVKLEPGGAFGLLKWDAMNPKICQVTGISNDIPVKKWTRVVTRGGSGIFPRNLPVGKVYRRKSIEGKPLWDLQIYIAEDFRTIQHVYVVKNLLVREIKQMQDGIPVDKEESDF